VRVLSSPKCAPVAGPEHGALRGLNATARAADFGQGMKEHLVANVASSERSVENSAVLISGRAWRGLDHLRCRTHVCGLMHLRSLRAAPGPARGPAFRGSTMEAPHAIVRPTLVGSPAPRDRLKCVRCSGRGCWGILTRDAFEIT